MRGIVYANSIGSRNGRVAIIETWVNWDSHLHCIIRIERAKNGKFYSYVGDPEHGGQYTEGATLNEVIGFLNPEIVERYEMAFGPRFDKAGAVKFFPGYVHVEVE